MTTESLFSCTCCKEPAPESDAAYDKDLDGPVCTTCRRNLQWAQAQLNVVGLRSCKKVVR